MVVVAKGFLKHLLSWSKHVSHHHLHLPSWHYGQLPSSLQQSLQLLEQTAIEHTVGAGYIIFNTLRMGWGWERERDETICLDTTSMPNPLFPPSNLRSPSVTTCSL